MQVNKHFLIGEALYRLSVYEKGRCAPSNIWWTKKYVTQLVDSINFMGEMVKALSDENITSHDYEIIRKCVQKKEIFYFNEVLLNQCKENTYFLSAHHNLSDYKEVNQLMSNIIEQLKQATQSLKRKNKYKIWYLLQALHNLPRVYLRPVPDALINFQIPPMTVDTAIECARNYLKMID